MRRTIQLLATLTLILIAAVPALGKGISSATVTGPGIDEPIDLLDFPDHDLETRDLMVKLIEQTGLWYATPALERIDPPGRLGEPLTIAWVNMGPPALSEEERTIRQVIYLHTEDGPVIHTPEGQPTLDGWGGEVTGWFRAPAELEESLHALGVPTTAGKMTFATPWVLGAVAALAFVASSVIRLVNSRLRPVVSSQ